MKKCGLLFLLLVYSAVVWCSTAEEQSVMQAGQNWALAVKSRDPEKIMSFFAPDAVAYPNYETMLDNQSEILNYFKGMSGHPNVQVVFNNQHIQVYKNAAVNSGLYTFSYSDHGKTIYLPARYTFVYSLTSKGWMIEVYHSSLIPKQ